MMSSNGAGTRVSSGPGSETTQHVARVITSAAWDLRVKRCEVAKGDLNEVWVRAVVACDSISTDDRLKCHCCCCVVVLAVHTILWLCVVMDSNICVVR